MKRIKLKLTNIASQIENEDFFSLRVTYNSSSENIQHIGFYNGNEDLLELIVDKDSGLLQRIQLTLCNHYSFDDTPLDTGSFELNDEEVYLELLDHIECGSFNMNVYNNCAAIKLSDITPLKYVKCGQVVFGLDDSKNILSIIVTELTIDNINHIRNELLLQ